MGDRKVYPPAEFEVTDVVKVERIGVSERDRVWHLVGRFAEGSIVSKDPRREYRLRVVPDPRWEGVQKVVLLVPKIYESESVAWTSRRHVYGSGNYYISKATDGPNKGQSSGEDTRFSFEDVQVLA